MSETPDAPPQSLAGLSIEDLLAFLPEGNGRLNDKMGVQLVEVSAERVVATMPVEGNTQPFGLLHGGASVVLAETLGSIGSAIHAYPQKIAVGVDINATHHRSATSGLVTGVATAIHLGRSSTSYDVVITDERGKRVCTSRITCALLDAARAEGRQPGTRSRRTRRAARTRSMRWRLVRGVGHLACLRQPGPYGAGGRRAQHRLRGEGQPRHEPVGVARLRGGRRLHVGDAALLGEAAGRLHERAAHALAAEPREDVRRHGQHGRLEVERREGRGLEVDRSGDLAVDLGHRDAVVLALGSPSR